MHMPNELQRHASSKSCHSIRACKLSVHQDFVMQHSLHTIALLSRMLPVLQPVNGCILIERCCNCLPAQCSVGTMYIGHSNMCS